MNDALTNLLSIDAFEQKILTCKNPKLFLVDIRHFKTINMTYGDEGGNFILCQLATTLQAFAHQHAMETYRIVDDKIALLIDQPFELEKMERIIFALMETLKDLHLTYHSNDIAVSTVIGISFDHFNALEKAQKALLVAKAEQQPFVTYSEFANMLMGENEEMIESMLKNAIENKQVVLHVQAVVDRNNRPFYYEGLLRLADQQSLQSPKLFLKIAKERGFYPLLFTSILQKAQTIALENKLHLALNIDEEDLLNDDLFHYLETHVDPQHIFLEIQCAPNAPFERLAVLLNRLKQKGFTLILDNVKQTDILMHFSGTLINSVKLHGELIRHLSFDPVAELTCKAIIALCQGHGIQTIASQLNSSTALGVAQNLGCDWFQGYIVEQPHGIDALTDPEH